MWMKMAKLKLGLAMGPTTLAAKHIVIMGDTTPTNLQLVISWPFKRIYDLLNTTARWLSLTDIDVTYQMDYDCITI